MKHLLAFNLPPALEEEMVDFLLARQEVEGFTSFRCHGHGSHVRLTLSEQVAGRRQRVQFEIIIDADKINNITEALAVAVGRDIAYWSYPVSSIGHT